MKKILLKMEDIEMQHFDLNPLFRSTIGFDRFGRLFDQLSRSEAPTNGYPPYNIEKVSDDAYRITMAVAGFGEKDIDVTLTENTLVIAGKRDDEEGDVTYLYRGIAGRAFERRFELADTIKVVGATLQNGVLVVELQREVPEHKKPRRIAISSQPALESKAA